VKIVIGNITGTAASQEDFDLYKKRSPANCRVLFDTKYRDGVLVHSPGYAVADFFDGGFMNFFYDKKVEV